VFHSNLCENGVSSKITFAQGFDDEPGSNMLMSYVLCLMSYVFQSPCFEHKHSDNQKAYEFGCLADDTTDKMN